MSDEAASTGQRRRGRPPASAGPSTRQRILDAAQRGFGELGYQGLTVEQVARQVGVDPRTVYHYFPSKRDLFRGAADAAFEASVTEAATLVLAHDDARGRLHGFIAFYRHLHRERPHAVPFFAAVIIESMAASRAATAGAATAGAPTAGGDARAAADRAPAAGTTGAADERPAFDATDIPGLGEPVRAMMRLMAEQAVARGDLDPSVDAGTASVLLQMIATGLGLVSRIPDASFPALLDALDLLVDGALLRS